MIHRRDFVRTCAGMTVVGMVPARYRLSRATPSHSIVGTTVVSTPTLRDPQVKALARTAVEAAQRAGARYADVRLTNTLERTFRGGSVWQSVRLGMSVRALVNGYWGWAASPVLSEADGVRIGRRAVELATVSAGHGKSRTVELGTVSVVHDAEWITPVTIDPFDLAVDDVADWMVGLGSYTADFGASRGSVNTALTNRRGTPGMSLNMQKQERLFASTDGSVLTQTVLLIEPEVGIQYRGVVVAPLTPWVGPAQVGWEWFTEIPIRDRIRQEIDRIDEMLARPSLSTTPVQIGRYDIVFTATAMATLLSNTLAPATELDRALGYEANAGGTSYLGPNPLQYLGTAVAAPLVTVTADRSTPRAMATVQWDDEGVRPANFPLVQNGTLVDYQTTREQAAWLASWYQQHSLSAQSHGCAMAPDALDVPMQHTPNLSLHPGSDDHTLEDLIAGVEHGLLVNDLSVDMDFQCQNGDGQLEGVTEIRHGKRAAIMTGAGLRFRSAEFWKNILALGGPKSVEWRGGYGSQKGEPGQTTNFSIGSVPALVKQLNIVDLTRKA